MPVGQSIAADRKPDPRVRAEWFAARRAETFYGTQLRKIARHIGDIIRGHAVEDEQQASTLAAALRRYADTIDPWARSAARRMVLDVHARTALEWRRAMAAMGVAMREQMAAPDDIGYRFRALMDQQVALIKSLPLEAAQRVHDRVREGVIKGERFTTIAKEIAEGGQVSRSRATLIARTETGRATSNMLQARAESAGSTTYIWRTMRDADVRPSHRALEGKVFSWADPPECDPGHRAHPGTIWNCFPGSTHVALTNGCHQLWRHRYEGRLVVIQHEMGLLELTPNHPILTDRGWVAAENIEAGDHIVQSVADNLIGLDDNKYQRIATFDEVFVALESVLNREAHSGLLFDFHGYVPDHEVDAIRAYHLLPGYGVSEAFERAANFALAGPNRRVEDFRVGGGAAHVGETHDARGFDQARAVLRAHRHHAADVGLAPGPALDTVARKDLADDGPGATDADRDGELALSADVGGDHGALVKVLSAVVAGRNAMRDYDASGAEALAQNVRAAPDFFCGGIDGRPALYKRLRVIEKGVRDFSGHVFTMATANGWFTVTSAGVVVKNCRCYSEPIIGFPEATPRRFRAH